MVAQSNIHLYQIWYSKTVPNQLTPGTIERTEQRREEEGEAEGEKEKGGGGQKGRGGKRGENMEEDELRNGRGRKWSWR
jgi:hypothetical protein